MGVNHDFSRPAFTVVSGGQQTALGTSSVRQMAKADIRGGAALSFERTMRQVQLMFDGGTMEIRDDSRRSFVSDRVLVVRCERQRILVRQLANAHRDGNERRKKRIGDQP